MERQLLGELYVDKAFLEKLLKDEGFNLVHLYSVGPGNLSTTHLISLSAPMKLTFSGK